MKDKKDPKIEEFLTRYAEQNRPGPSVTQPARRLMEEKNAAAVRGKVPHTPKTGRRIALALGAAAAVFVLVVVAVQVGLFLRLGDTGQQRPDLKPDPPRIYTEQEVRVRTLSSDAIPEEVDLSWMTEDMQIESALEFRFKEDDSLAFVRLRIRMTGEMQADDLQINVEVTDRVYRPFEAYTQLDDYPVPGLQVLGVTAYIDGEYMSSAYFRRKGGKFYLNLISPVSGRFSEILLKFAGTEGDARLL